MMTNEEVLNSWKEVASYMGRGVRTVQRWEQELGLPVRRPRGKSRSAVIAFRSELDQWLHRAPSEMLQPEAAEEPATPVRHIDRLMVTERHAKLHDNTAQLLDKTQLLLSRSNSLCAQLNNLREKVERTVQLTFMKVERNAKTVGVNTVPKALNGEAIPANGPGPGQKQHAIAS